MAHLRHWTGLRQYLGCQLFCLLTALLLAGVGCRTVQENNVLLDSKVVRLRGTVRSSRDGQAWCLVRVGDVLAPGAMVQTSNDEKTFVDLVLGDALRPQSPVKKSHGFNAVRLFGGSTLKIGKVATQNNCDYPLEVKLDLLAGKMLGYVSPCAPGLDYALGLTNGIVRARGNTIYEITAGGELAVITGAVTLTLTDRNLVQEVVGPHKFDPGTGLLTEIPRPANYFPQPDGRILPTPSERLPWPKRKF